MKTIVIGNIAENDLRRIDSETLSADWQSWVDASLRLTDRAFFWEGDDKLVITSLPYDSLWMSDIQRWLGWENVENRCPQTTSYYICDDILADEQLMAELQNFIAGEPLVKLISWGSTKGMNQLLAALQKLGQVYAPELMPDERFDLGLYFDSKSGFRELCEPLSQIHSQVRLPVGTVCERADALVPTVSSHFLDSNHPFVIKSDYRSGGSGVLIYRPKDLAQKSPAMIRQEIKEWQGDGDFFPPPYIVEEYILNHEDTASILCYHGVIQPDGQIELLGHCGTLIENESYRGTVISDEFDPDHLRQVTEMAEIVGAAMYEQGYYGRLNLDFVVSVTGEVHIIEINAARRGASVYAYEVHNILQQQSPEMTNALTYDHFDLPTEGPLSYAQVRPVFHEFRQNPPIPGCLYLPILVSSLSNKQPYLGYMVAGPSSEAVADARVHLEEALCRQVQNL